MKQSLLQKVIVIDIETVSSFAQFEDMDYQWQELWAEKVLKILPADEDFSSFYKRRAAVMAEFGKIICISLGRFDENLNVQTKSFYGNDESQILNQFICDLNQIRIEQEFIIAGHNIKEFDIPFICRRLIVNNIFIPNWLNFQNTKPWENNLYDTFQYWRFGDYKNYTSLKLLAKLLDVNSPKDDIDGSVIGSLYWESDPILQELNLKRIETYCKKDVEATASIIKRLQQCVFVNQSK